MTSTSVLPTPSPRAAPRAVPATSRGRATRLGTGVRQHPTFPARPFAPGSPTTSTPNPSGPAIPPTRRDDAESTPR